MWWHSRTQHPLISFRTVRGTEDPAQGCPRIRAKAENLCSKATTHPHRIPHHGIKAYIYWWLIRQQKQRERGIINTFLLLERVLCSITYVFMPHKPELLVMHARPITCEAQNTDGEDDDSKYDGSFFFFFAFRWC